jgi:Arc/MetJ-type ribon-helix-helix transcriptional regulator
MQLSAIKLRHYPPDFRVVPKLIFSYAKRVRIETDIGESHVNINLTPEQERRLQTIISRGAYKSVDEVVEAALAAVEQRALPGFAGTPAELEALLAEGLASDQLTESKFWNSVKERTDTLLAEYNSGSRS